MNKNIFIFSIFVLMLLAACVQPPATPGQPNNQQTPLELGTFETQSFDPGTDLTTQHFETEEELTEFLTQYRNTGYNMYRGGGDVMLEAVDFDRVAALPTLLEGAKVDYSETNNQVASVDEADILKTDGEYIYTITNNVLYIIKAYPGEDAEVVETIDYENTQPTSLFVNGDYLAVFGNYYNLDFFKDMDFRPQSGMTFFDVYDISDKNNPEKVEEYKFEGNYFNARMMDGYVYFLTRTWPEPRPIPMPIIVDGIEPRPIPLRDIAYYPVPYENPQFVTVHAINLNKPSDDVSSKAVVVEGSQNMYMSENTIYLTYTENINEWQLRQDIQIELIEPKLTETDKKLIEKIKKTDNDVLSYYEKESKIQSIMMSYLNYLTSDEQDELNDETERLLKQKLEEYPYLEYTIINTVHVDEGEITVGENGKAPGHIINQFSMDEWEETFRIATTINERWSSFDEERSESTSNVYTLTKDMKPLGKIEGLAENEQIYSTRFMGERLYMVTFRQVDPFFVIDLSDPKNPETLGKLKIPGFSRYLHPYDKNTIIGLGQDTTETGRTTGLKISLFDVTDVSKPKEIAQFVTEERYVQSTAMWEHKAFLFSKEKNLLVIPAYNREYDWRGETEEGYNGAFVFDISKDDIELRGLIDHSMASNTDYWYQPQVERSLYIEELLYTKSPTLLRINRLSDLESVKDVELKQRQGTIKIY